MLVAAVTRTRQRAWALHRTGGCGMVRPMAEDRYHVRDDEVELERRRLGYLAETRDPKTFAVLADTGVTAGWRCLEIGAGAGTVSCWLGEQVGSAGEVVSTDVDLRFHGPVPANVSVREHDITRDEVAGPFDLIHARAVLQHLPERDAVLDTLVAALAPGGWLVIEDGNFLAFAEQTLPEPLATVHRLICMGVTTSWRDPNLALRLLDEFRQRGLEALDVVGDAWAMRPGEASGEWWFLAVERAGPRLVEAGLITPEQFAEAVSQMRAPGFVMMSTLSLAIRGRRPDPTRP